MRGYSMPLPPNHSALGGGEKLLRYSFCNCSVQTLPFRHTAQPWDSACSSPLRASACAIQIYPPKFSRLVGGSPPSPTRRLWNYNYPLCVTFPWPSHFYLEFYLIGDVFFPWTNSKFLGVRNHACCIAASTGHNTLPYQALSSSLLNEWLF